MEPLNINSCPICGSRNVGKIKPKHYFCRECFSELEFDQATLIAYEIDVDGSLKIVGKSA
jgi:DNA-directed RNA polymerase subunit RPC12/RpoP